MDIKRSVCLIVGLLWPVVTGPQHHADASSPATGTYYVGEVHFNSTWTRNDGQCPTTAVTNDYDLVLRYEGGSYWHLDLVGRYLTHNCDGSPTGPPSFSHRVNSYIGPANAEFLTDFNGSLVFTFSGATVDGRWDSESYGMSEHTAMTLTAMTQSGPITIDVIDPMCQSNGVSIADQVCPGSYLTDAGGLVDDLALLRSASVTRTGVVADGVTKLLVRVHTTVPVMLEMHLDTPQATTLSNYWGTLATRSEAVHYGDTVVVRPEGDPPMAFAVYQSRSTCRPCRQRRFGYQSWGSRRRPPR